MTLSPLEFPKSLPEAYQEFDEDTHYDAKKHLALEQPEQIWTLEDFGYDPQSIADCASPIAVTSPFRVLSDEGARVVHGVATRMKQVMSNIAGDRAPSHLAGGVYRSRFLRDLCACPVIHDHMSGICGTRLAAHSLPSQQLYINYSPEDISKAVDAWHYDGIGFDYVIMLSDPAKLRGGFFEYFKGTKFEIAEKFGIDVAKVRFGVTEDLEPERVIQVRFPGPGYAIFQQGNMVVHRATRLEAPGDRITMVPGLVALDTTTPDPTATSDIFYYAEPGAFAEVARHSAWLAQAKLSELIDRLPLTNDVESIENAIKTAIVDVTDTLEKLADKQADQEA